jgi:hypothetical protein
VIREYQAKELDYDTVRRVCCFLVAFETLISLTILRNWQLQEMMPRRL